MESDSIVQNVCINIKIILRFIEICVFNMQLCKIIILYLNASI